MKNITFLLLLLTFTLTAQTYNTIPSVLPSGQTITCVPFTVPGATPACNEITGTLPDDVLTIDVLVHYGKPCCLESATDLTCCRTAAYNLPAVFADVSELQAYVAEYVDTQGCGGVDFQINILPPSPTSRPGHMHMTKTRVKKITIQIIKIGNTVHNLDIGAQTWQEAIDKIEVYAAMNRARERCTRMGDPENVYISRYNVEHVRLRYNDGSGLTWDMYGVPCRDAKPVVQYKKNAKKRQ